MKANELMIGDWVWYNNQPYQIRELGIFGENRDGDDYPAVCVGKPNGVGLILERNEIKPIPITAEILKKNGLKWLYSEPSGNFAYCSNEPPIHCTFIPNSGWFVSIGASGSTKVPFVEASMIQHVHELQHALRLCGIDKEIVL